MIPALRKLIVRIPRLESRCGVAILLLAVLATTLSPRTVSQPLQHPGGFRLTDSATATGGYAMSLAGRTLSSRSGGMAQGLGAPSGRTVFAGLSPQEGVPVDAFRFALHPGWNLRACPMRPQETVGELFAGPAGHPIKVGALFAWDGNDYTTVPDSHVLTPTQGFWVYSYWGGTGRAATPAAPPYRTLLVDELHAGWNLFGPSQLSSLPSPATGVHAAWRWDTGNQRYVKLASGALLHPGQAYWIYRSDSGGYARGAAQARGTLGPERQ